MQAKSQGFILLEAILSFILFSIICFGISNFLIYTLYETYKLHYINKAYILIDNYLQVKECINNKTDDILLNNIKKQAKDFFPDGKVIVSSSSISIKWTISLGRLNKSNEYNFKFHNKPAGFILLESICYLLILSLIILSSLSLFHNLNIIYKLQNNIFSVDNSFNLAKSYIKNDIKQSINTQILSFEQYQLKSKNLNINKKHNSDILYIEKQSTSIDKQNNIDNITYIMKKNKDNQIGLFRSVNFKRFEQIVSNIYSVKYELYFSNNKKLLNIKFYGKQDVFNDYIEVILRL